MASKRLYDWVAISVRVALEHASTEERYGIAHLAVMLADDFKHDNTRFDRQRFYTACGLSSTGRVYP